MNYKYYCHSAVECTIEATDEEYGEYYEDDGETYYVETSFTKAKEHLIRLIQENMYEWQMVLRDARQIKKSEIKFT